MTTAPAVMNLAESAPSGAAVGWTHNGQLQTEFGGVDGGHGQPIGSQTVFDLASVTKVLATTCALHRLAGSGQIGLADPVGRYLPWLPYSGSLTLADLAHHRAGLWEWQPLYLAGKPPREALAELPLRYPPHTERHYSDLGFMLLGLVIEAVMNCPLDRAATDLVYSPLGLKRVSFAPVQAPVASGGLGDTVERRMVASGQPYPVVYNDPSFVWRDGETIGQANDGNAYHGFGGVAGHAGLFANLADVLALLGSLASDDDFWVPTASSAVWADGPDDGQAFGWRSQSVKFQGRPTRLLWHPGFTGCAVGFIPGSGFGLAMLTNRLLAEVPAETSRLWAATLADLTDLRLIGGESR